MNAADILSAVRQVGAALRVEGESLVASNASRIAPAIKAAIRKNKPELIAALLAPSGPVCMVCGEAGDLWHLDTPSGPVAVHGECARFLPKPEPAEPSWAYRAVSIGPDGVGAKVEIIELPATGLRYRPTFAHLQLKPPALIDVARWRQCVADGRAFLHQWGQPAQQLGWSSADLFGLHTPPAKPRPSYNRLSRYDATGLCWLLQGRRVLALTETTATIQNPNTGAITTYRRFNKPALGPLGDSLEDLK
jgi:hypothetical protein